MPYAQGAWIAAAAGAGAALLVTVVGFPFIRKKVAEFDAAANGDVPTKDIEEVETDAFQNKVRAWGARFNAHGMCVYVYEV